MVMQGGLLESTQLLKNAVSKIEQAKQMKLNETDQEKSRVKLRTVYAMLGALNGEIKSREIEHSQTINEIENKRFVELD